MRRVKPAHLAGTWYESSAERLRDQTDALLAAAAPAVAPVRVAGITVPHAAYRYSGAVAATAYRLVQGGPYRRAVIVAPSHRTLLPGAAMLDVDAFSTPLGEVPVDTDALGLLGGHALVRRDPEPFAVEHSIEVQLPLLQRVLPAVAVVPLLLGGLDPDEVDEFGCLLECLAGPATLFIVSTDFAHYGAKFDYLPFAPCDAEAVRTGLRQLDMGAIDRVVAGDLAGFQRYVADTAITICGQIPMAVFLAWNGAQRRGTLLRYATSLDVTGDYQHSVSYAAIVFGTP
ncbi:MAG: AmmeMemoRadiSam system protein B [Deltaproteobacteria bacterium]|nr:AmmeMemoRadiSam system protein B [Deltaproteobacteria bacterium]MBI3389004.1 AmmeMemoRadiSam system protein B [Deltaproteobacteria bacterium]